MKEKIKRTPLYNQHLERGARMGFFGGYEMPLWYPLGTRNEHLAVIRSAGIFDTSHMAVITVSGTEAFDLLQLCFSKDLNACVGLKKRPMEIGKAVYGVFLNEDGTVIDDALIYMRDKNSFMIVVNAGMGAVVAKHLESHHEGQDVHIEDWTDKLGKVDIQGPQSLKIIEKIIQQPEKVFEKLPYFSFKGSFDQQKQDEAVLLDGIPVMLSRTGYTGEFGFEIFVESQRVLELWNLLLKAGEEFDLWTCGLAARDSLRAGAVLPLSHQDIGGWPFTENPWPFALPLTEDGLFSKNFIGADALQAVKNPEFTMPFAGFDLRKVHPSEKTSVVDENDNTIGTLLTCVTDMAIDRHKGRIFSVASEDSPADMKFSGLCCGFVKVRKRLSPGQIVYLLEGNRKLKVEIVKDIRPNRTARMALKKARYYGGIER